MAVVYPFGRVFRLEDPADVVYGGLGSQGSSALPPFLSISPVEVSLSPSLSLSVSVVSLSSL